jgi:hypothetical protein
MAAVLTPNGSPTLEALAGEFVSAKSNSAQVTGCTSVKTARALLSYSAAERKSGNRDIKDAIATWQDYKIRKK